MDNNDSLELTKQQERLLRYMARKYQSRDTDLNKKLSTIHETNQSIEKEDESSTGIQRGQNNRPVIQEECDMEFEMEPKDVLLEKIEEMALAMDTHKCGVLYIQELEEMVKRIDEELREAIWKFLSTYMKKTGKKTMSIPSFIVNVHKAAMLGKFGLQEVLLPELRAPHSETIAHNSSWSQTFTPTNISAFVLPDDSSVYSSFANPRKSQAKALYAQSCKPTLSVFTPAMQRRLKSPKNVLPLSPRGDFKKPPIQPLLSPKASPRGAAKLPLKKGPFIEDKETSLCTFKPFTVSNEGKYKYVKPKVGCMTTKSSTPKTDFDATFAQMYEKIKAYSTQAPKKEKRIPKTSALTNYGTLSPKSPKLVTIKVDASFLAKSFEKDNSSTSRGSGTVTHRPPAKKQSTKSRKEIHWGIRRSSLW